MAISARDPHAATATRLLNRRIVGNRETES